MKKTIKIAVISIITAIILLASNSVFAMSGTDIKQSADNWLNKGSQNTPITTEEAWTKLIPVGRILVSIASVILVVCYMYLGIKYMMADPSGKADVKQRLIYLVIATVLIYGGVGIFTVVVNLMNSILS